MGKRRSKKVPILIFVILVELLVIVALLSQMYFVFAYNDLEVRDYTAMELVFDEMEYTITKQEAKELVATLYNVEHSYEETNDLPESDAANSNIARKEVRIRPDLELLEYTISYAHELTHIKYRSYDETYTAYQTFVDLYESGHAELQNMSIVYAQSVLYGCYAGTEYDCGYYILEYLIEIDFPMIK